MSAVRAGNAAASVASYANATSRVARVDLRSSTLDTVWVASARPRSASSFSARRRTTASRRRSSEWDSHATVSRSSVRRATRSTTPRAAGTTTSGSDRHCGPSHRTRASTIGAWNRSWSRVPAMGNIRTPSSIPRQAESATRASRLGFAVPPSMRATCAGSIPAQRAKSAREAPASVRASATCRPIRSRTVRTTRARSRVPTGLLVMTVSQLHDAYVRLRGEFPRLGGQFVTAGHESSQNPADSGSSGRERVCGTRIGHEDPEFGGAEAGSGRIRVCESRRAGDPARGVAARGVMARERPGAWGPPA